MMKDALGQPPDAKNAILYATKLYLINGVGVLYFVDEYMEKILQILKIFL
jgi:hypothetical protein